MGKPTGAGKIFEVHSIAQSNSWRPCQAPTEKSTRGNRRLRQNSFRVTAPTRNFVEYINDFGPYRYLEISNIAFGRDLSNLDRAVWEFRRYCSESEEHRRVKLVHGVIPPKVRLEGGHLESVIDDDKCPAREPLLWQNAFFGRKPRRWVKRKPWLKAKNSPLYLYPQMLDEILRYIYLPSHIVAGYRAHKQSK